MNAPHRLNYLRRFGCILILHLQVIFLNKGYELLNLVTSGLAANILHILPVCNRWLS